MDKLLTYQIHYYAKKQIKFSLLELRKKKLPKNDANNDKAPGVGLAANQIGILKQIVTIFCRSRD